MKKKIQKYLSGEREGFSLIELIIVIAIMAILIGVVALVVLPYLESSRESTDRAAMNEVATAFKSAASNATLASKIDVGAAKKFNELDNDVQTKINSYLEKKVGDIKFSSTNAKDKDLYFMKDTTRGFVVFIGSSATASVSDSDGTPFSSDGAAVGGAAQNPDTQNPANDGQG